MENVPRKKSRRALKKQTVLALLAIAAVAIAVAAHALQGQPELPGLEPWPEPVMLLTGDKESISSLTVAPREGAACLLVRGEGGFLLAGGEDMPLRESIVNEMLAVAEYLQAENTILAPEEWDADKVNLADFGLDNPWVRLEIAYENGSRVEARFGNEAPNETPQRYCLVSGVPGLYTALTAETDVFFYDLDALRAFDQPELDASLLDRIDVSGSVTLGMYYTPSGWYMDAPRHYPLRAAGVEALLNHISAMAFDSCLGEADDLDLSAYGLAEPALTVRLTQAATVISGETTEGEPVSVPVAETEYSLLLGDETGRSGVYLLWEGRVFKASNFLLGFWKELNPEDLLLQSPINFPINDLTRVSLQAPGVEAAYHITMVESVTPDNRIATDEYGRILYDCEVTREGENSPMDAQAFLDWYVALAALSPDGRLPKGYQVSGEPRAAVLLSNDHVNRTVALYPYDALHDAISVDGEALWFVSRSWLDGVLDTP